MAEIYNILIDLQTQLDSVLSSTTSYIFEDPIDIVNNYKTFPFYNLDCETKEVVPAENQKTYDFERRMYTIMITCGVRAKSKSLAKRGIWDLSESIESAYQKDRTIAGNVNDIVRRPDIATDAIKYQDFNFWIGRGMIIFQVYVDDFIRKF